ncbi:hypothetical protein L3i22_100500 [Actinoplanes sp. L3-i22]|nr:hypothetical protein L3i22_100500 [Actinoplanes sp. L3-i22]
MTAAGLAFIAGGLATLISFRAVLFGAGDDDEGQARAAAPPEREHRPRIPAPPARARRAPHRETGYPQDDEPPVDNEPGRGRRLAAAFSGRSEADADRRRGLASVGLAEESWQDDHSWYDDQLPDEDEDEVPEEVRDYDYPEEPGEPGHDEASRFIDNTPWRPEPGPAPAEDDWILVSESGGYQGPPPRPAPIDRSDRGYGDRINGWVRPRYRDLDDRPPAGDYWTPVPDDLYADPEPSARGYGWPVPVERLPSVPDYESATGFDLTPVQAAEPTTLMPNWTPPGSGHQIRLPRSWATRDEQGRGGRRTEIGFNRAEPSWNDPSRRGRIAADAEPARDRGPRPRPRPRPAAAESDSSYRSRHAAGPHG